IPDTLIADLASSLPGTISLKFRLSAESTEIQFGYKHPSSKCRKLTLSGAGLNLELLSTSRGRVTREGSNPATSATHARYVKPRSLKSGSKTPSTQSSKGNPQHPKT